MYIHVLYATLSSSSIYVHVGIHVVWDSTVASSKENTMSYSGATTVHMFHSEN